MNTMLAELNEYRQDWKLLTFGLFAAYIDGIVIAQAHDWMSAGHRLSIWILL